MRGMSPARWWRFLTPRRLRSRRAGGEPGPERRPRLEDLTFDEWEALCDRCGLCCLVKLADEDDGAVDFTLLACRHLDLEACRCSCYADRAARCPDCIVLRPDLVASSALPPTCAYVRVASGRPLPPWHPRVSGDPRSVERALGPLRRRFIPEDLVSEDEAEDFVVTLPDDE
jgi:hypothetical protein